MLRMPTFVFEAIDQTGQVLRGAESARDLGEVADRLRLRGLTVLDVREKQNLRSRLVESLGYGDRIPLYSTVVMMRQLATMVRAGVPLGRTLDCLTHQGLDSKVEATLFEIHKEIQTGFTLAQAFENQGGKFPEITAPLIKAGEMSGHLDEMLDRLAIYFEKDLALRRSWQQASLYPFVVFGVCCFVTLGLVTYVFPIFIEMFRGLDVNLPVFTRALITATETIRNPIVLLPVLFGILTGAGFLWQYLLTPVGRRQWDWLRLEVPYLGPLARKVALSRVARTLGTLLSSGVPMLSSLRIAGTASGNWIIRDAIERVSSQMKKGEKFSDQLGLSEIFPAVFVQMVQAGEEAGEVNVMLHRLGDFFEEEVQLAMVAFTSLIEPVMIACMGSLVLFVLVAVFQPISQLMALF